jgi:hypothetical protein
MRVAMVTTLEQSVLHGDVDRPFHEASFSARGVELVTAAWDDPTVDWDSFDLVVVRSPWNYPEHLGAFLTWLGERERLTRFHNPAALIRWNLDKRYLADLASSGVAVVPTGYADRPDQLAAALAAGARQAAELVVKPTVSAGSRLTGRFRADSPDAVHLCRRILDRGLGVMVQPFARSVDVRGEHSAVAFDGVVSHTFRKGPILAEDGRLIGDVYREEVTPVALSPAEREVLDATLTASTELARTRGWLGPDEQLLYARVDLITLDDGRPALLEAELFEPCFFFPVDPLAAERFLDAVIARAETNLE